MECRLMLTWNSPDGEFDSVPVEITQGAALLLDGAYRAESEVGPVQVEALEEHLQDSPNLIAFKEKPQQFGPFTYYFIPEAEELARRGAACDEMANLHGFDSFAEYTAARRG